MKQTSLVLIPLLALFATTAHGAIFVESVVPGSAASEAGVQADDQLIRLDDQDIATHDDLQKVMATHRPGDAVPLAVVREGETLDLTLTFGERPDGGVSIGVRLQIVIDPGAEPGQGTTACLEWIEKTYRIESMMRDLGLELSEDHETMRACVGHDTARMTSDNAVKYCDNVFKVHCSGVDLLAEIGEALVRRCEAQLDESLGLRLDRYNRWRTCGQHKVFERYSATGESSDEGMCKAAFLDECGTNIDASIEAGETSSEQREFVECCAVDPFDTEGRSGSGRNCEMIDDGFKRGPCHDRSICINRYTSEWIHCSALD